MKKIVLLFIIIFSAIYTMAQMPSFPYSGNVSTGFGQNGPIGSKTGFVYAVSFADTTAVNSHQVAGSVVGYLKNMPGMTVRCGDDLYVRNNNATKWLKQSTRGVALVGTVGGSNPDDPAVGTGSYQNNKLIGLGANLTIIIDGNVFVNYGNNSSFTFSSVTGTVSGIRWISGSSVFITLNQ